MPVISDLSEYTVSFVVVVKEASVVLGNYYRKNNIDAKILIWVHDEIVCKIPKYLDGKSKEWFDYLESGKHNLIAPFSKRKNLPLPEIKKEIMIEVANLYLKNVTIKVDNDVEPYWTK